MEPLRSLENEALCSGYPESLFFSSPTQGKTLWSSWIYEFSLESVNEAHFDIIQA